MDSLQASGHFKVKRGLKTSVKEIIADSTAFYESMHVNIMEALMMADADSVGLDNVIDEMGRFEAFVEMKITPFDMEDALLIYVNLFTESDDDEITDLVSGLRSGIIPCKIISRYNKTATDELTTGKSNKDRITNHKIFIGACKALDVVFPWTASEVASLATGKSVCYQKIMHAFLLSFIGAVRMNANEIPVVEDEKSLAKEEVMKVDVAPIRISRRKLREISEKIAPAEGVSYSDKGQMSGVTSRIPRYKPEVGVEASLELAFEKDTTKGEIEPTAEKDKEEPTRHETQISDASSDDKPDKAFPQETRHITAISNIDTDQDEHVKDQQIEPISSIESKLDEFCNRIIPPVGSNQSLEIQSTSLLNPNDKSIKLRCRISISQDESKKDEPIISTNPPVESKCDQLVEIQSTSSFPPSDYEDDHVESKEDEPFNSTIPPVGSKNYQSVEIQSSFHPSDHEYVETLQEYDVQSGDGVLPVEEDQKTEEVSVVEQELIEDESSEEVDFPIQPNAEANVKPASDISVEEDLFLKNQAVESSGNTTAEVEPSAVPLDSKCSVELTQSELQEGEHVSEYDSIEFSLNKPTGGMESKKDEIISIASGRNSCFKVSQDLPIEKEESDSESDDEILQIYNVNPSDSIIIANDSNQLTMDTFSHTESVVNTIHEPAIKPNVAPKYRDEIANATSLHHLISSPSLYDGNDRKSTSSPYMKPSSSRSSQSIAFFVDMDSGTKPKKQGANRQANVNLNPIIKNGTMPVFDDMEFTDVSLRPPKQNVADLLRARRQQYTSPLPIVPSNIKAMTSRRPVYEQEESDSSSDDDYQIYVPSLNSKTSTTFVSTKQNIAKAAEPDVSAKKPDVEVVEDVKEKSATWEGRVLKNQRIAKVLFLE